MGLRLMWRVRMPRREAVPCVHAQETPLYDQGEGGVKFDFPDFPVNQPGPTTVFYTLDGQRIWWYSDGNPYVILDPLSHDLSRPTPRSGREE